MKKCNKLFSLMLSTALLFTAALPSSVFAEDTVNNLVWNDGDTVSEITINQDTNIVVSGTVTVEKSINITDGNVSVSGGGKLMRSDTDLASNLFNISGGNVAFTDISIDGNNIEVSAYGAIGASGGNVVINDGTVIENNIKRKYGNTNRTVGGPAVCALGAATITMNGGILQNNVSHRRGGAVYLENGAVFNMNGGTVKNNKTEPDIDADSIYGGGAFYVRNAELNIAGGSIVNNAATLYRGNGGGIYNSSYGTTRITGGYISGNTANLSGNGIYHSSKEDTTAVFEIGGGANVEDDIYLSSDNAYKYSKITSQLHSNIKFTVGDNSYDRVIAEGSDYTLTYADMAKMQVTNSDMALSLENNQIRLTQTANNTYTLYFGYDANGGSGTPASKELTITEGADYPAETVDFTVTPTRAGYTFLGWDTDKTATAPKYTAANAPRTITIDNNITLYAIWEKIPVYYEVKAISENGGTVSGGGTVKENESATLTATANDGYTFDGWYDGDTKVCATEEFTVSNVTADKTYTAKFTKTVSRLFSTSDFKTLLDKIKTDGVTTYKCDQITAVHFVDLADYNMTDVAYSDYSTSGDGSVKAWMDGTELYIGGYEKIIAGKRLRSAFWHGDKINSITGLEMLDTSNVTDMSFMFYACGYSSNVFTLDLGDTFNTSNVTDMSYMFYYCGYNCDAFTLDLGANFDTSKVTNMDVMFFRCGESSKAFTTLDLSTFKVSADTNLSKMAREIPVTTFIFGDGWAGAKLPTAGSSNGAFYMPSETDTTIVGATENLLNYDWASDNRNIGGSKPKTYTVTASAETGGTVSGGGKVAEGENVTLTAAANDGYTFDGWYDGDTKVCDTAEFVVENVTADKTYTAKFTKNPIVDPDPTFDFTSLRTLKTKNITVNHETKTIDIDAADDAEYITIFVYQKDVIPGGTFKMASYMGNKVVYDKNGSYRIYFVHNFTVPVKANITINGVTEQYLVNVNFDASKAKFDFTSLKGENFSNITVNHSDKTVHITANDSADNIILYVNQHSTVYGGKLRMASYLGNKVTYDPSGVYTIYANGKNSVSVKTNITINGVTEQYLITVDFPSVVWGFDTVNAENVKNVSIDHENKVITLDVDDNCNNILLYIDQICQSNIKGQIWMKSYLGNKVVYNASDRTYTITKKDKNSITVKTKITMLGETRYYDININFTENN